MKSVFGFCLMLGLYCGFAQKGRDRISISFDNISLKEAVVLVQQTSGYEFFYLDDWLVSNSISGNYKNAPIAVVLDEIFKGTNINYYIMEGKKIILTNGSVIYDSLPETFFISALTESQDSIPLDEIDTEEILPILQANDQELVQEKIEVIKIGREKKSNTDRSATITGRAINAKTKTPISDLVILIKGIQGGTTTNAQGFYSIQVPLGTHEIEVSALGIQGQRKKIILYGDGRLDFELNEGFEVLDEVVIEGNRNNNIEQTIGGVLQIEVKEIKNIPLVLGERDIFKVATTLPGVTTAGEGAAGFNVRGGRTDQNLILLDHAVLYNPSHFFGLFSAVNPFTSNNVDIYKGNIPAEYGGRLSSVFDISTKDGNNKKLSGEASIGPVTTNLTLETPIAKDKSSLLVGGRTTYSKWILRSLKDESIKNSEASFSDIIAKYNHQINSNNNLNIMGYYSNDAFNITRDSLYSYSNRLFFIAMEPQVQ